MFSLEIAFWLFFFNFIALIIITVKKIKSAKSKSELILSSLEINQIYSLKEFIGHKLQMFTYSFCFVFEYQLSCKEM